MATNPLAGNVTTSNGPADISYFLAPIIDYKSTSGTQTRIQRDIEAGNFRAEEFLRPGTIEKYNPVDVLKVLDSHRQCRLFLNYELSTQIRVLRAIVEAQKQVLQQAQLHPESPAPVLLPLEKYFQEILRNANNKEVWAGEGKRYQTSSGCPCWDRTCHCCIPAPCGFCYIANMWYLCLCFCCEEVADDSASRSRNGPPCICCYRLCCGGFRI